MDFPATAPHTGTLASLDLAIFTRKHALSNALQATAHRRALLQSRDDAQLGPLLGTTHADMIRSATHRRASETLSRHAEQLSALLLRPGSRMATLARVPGGAVSQLATARGLPMASAGGEEGRSSSSSEGGWRSPHSLPSSPRRARELQGTLAGLLAATAATAAAAGPGAAAALQAQPPTTGLARAAEAQTRSMERTRRAASADTARRKHARLPTAEEQLRQSQQRQAAEQAPSVTARALALPQRIARREYVVSLGLEPSALAAQQGWRGSEVGGGGSSSSSSSSSRGGSGSDSGSPPGSAFPPSSRRRSRSGSARARSTSPPAATDVRVLPQRTALDQYSLPSPLRLPAQQARQADAAARAAALAEEAEAAALEGRRPASATLRSPFSPHRLLPRLAAAAPPPPAYTHAPEAGVPYPGMHSYGPASHSFRDRRMDRELGPARAVTGSIAAEPRRVFVAGRPGVVDGEGTARLEEERAARGLGPEAHPFPASPKSARLQSSHSLEPWLELGTSQAVPEGGGDVAGDAARRAGALGRPYMLLPRHCDELRTDVGHEWSAWRSPARRLPDDLRQPLGPALPPVQAAVQLQLLCSSRESLGSAPSTVHTPSHGHGYPAHLDYVRSAAAAVTARSAGEASASGNAVRGGASARCNAGHGHGFSPGALTVLAASPDVGGTPRSPRSHKLRVIAARAAEEAAAACGRSGSEGATASEHVLYKSTGGTRAGEAAAIYAGLTSSGSIGKAVSSALARPTPAGAQGFVHFTCPASPPTAPAALKAAHTIDVAAFAGSGVDPLLQAGRAGAPTGTPRLRSATPSRWRGPWQGGAPVQDSFAHSPMRDGLAYYRMATEGREADGAEVAATARLVEGAAPGTLSPRCAARMGLSGAGRDAHLDAPSPREQAVAVAGLRATEREGGAGLGAKLGGASPQRALLGTLGASLARSEAERVLAQALHAGAAGFLPLASARPSFTSRKGDHATITAQQGHH